tara:strand:- start:373 stop:1767 length:1395 start_codon:yes stop_codon:yes gene_type:complete
MDLNFYLSSHGTTHLYNLFIDKDRNPPVYPIEGIPDGVQVEIHYKIKGKQMQSVLSRHDSLSRSTKVSKTIFDESVYNDYMIIYATGRKRIGGIIKRVELVKDGKTHVFYDPEKGIIENVPNIEYSYEKDIFTAGLLELEPEPEITSKGKSKKKKAKNKKRTSKPISNNWWQRGGGGLKPIVIYEGLSQIKYNCDMDDDDEEFDIHLFKGDIVEIIKYKGDPSELFEDPSGWLYIKQKDGKNKWISKAFIKPKFYTGSAWDTETFGFLHSSRPESWTEIKIDDETISSPAELYDGGVYEQGCFKDQSFLNMLFGGGKKNWDPSLYLDFPGCGKKLNKHGVNIVNIYGSHCLNPEGYEEHLSFGNVIPFILGEPGLWAHLFKDELLKGAKEEVEYLTGLLTREPEFLRSKERERIKGIRNKLRIANDAVKTMKQLNQKNLGPVLTESRKKRKTARKKKKKNTKRK